MSFDDVVVDETKKVRAPSRDRVCDIRFPFYLQTKKFLFVLLIPSVSMLRFDMD